MEEKDRQLERRVFIIIFLGALSAFGPFVMDMYLPVLPAMENGSDVLPHWYSSD